MNEDITMHCTMTMIGVEDIYDIKDDEERKERLQEFYKSYVESKQMIKKEIGLEATDKLFGAISKAKHNSTYISYYRKVKKDYEKGVKLMTANADEAKK